MYLQHIECMLRCSDFMWKPASKWRYLKKGVRENPREAFLVADDWCRRRSGLEPYVISDWIGYKLLETQKNLKQRDAKKEIGPHVLGACERQQDPNWLDSDYWRELERRKMGRYLSNHIWSALIIHSHRHCRLRTFLSFLAASASGFRYDAGLTILRRPYFSVVDLGRLLGGDGDVGSVVVVVLLHGHDCKLGFSNRGFSWGRLLCTEREIIQESKGK